MALAVLILGVIRPSVAQRVITSTTRITIRPATSTALIPSRTNAGIIFATPTNNNNSDDLGDSTTLALILSGSIIVVACFILAAYIIHKKRKEDEMAFSSLISLTAGRDNTPSDNDKLEEVKSANTWPTSISLGAPKPAVTANAALAQNYSSLYADQPAATAPVVQNTFQTYSNLLAMQTKSTVPLSFANSSLSYYDHQDITRQPNPDGYFYADKLGRPCNPYYYDSNHNIVYVDSYGYPISKISKPPVANMAVTGFPNLGSEFKFGETKNTASNGSQLNTEKKTRPLSVNSRKRKSIEVSALVSSIVAAEIDTNIGMNRTTSSNSQTGTLSRSINEVNDSNDIVIGTDTEKKIETVDNCQAAVIEEPLESQTVLENTVPENAVTDSAPEQEQQIQDNISIPEVFTILIKSDNYESSDPKAGPYQTDYDIVSSIDYGQDVASEIRKSGSINEVPDYQRSLLDSESPVRKTPHLSVIDLPVAGRLSFSDIFSKFASNLDQGSPVPAKEYIKSPLTARSPLAREFYSKPEAENAIEADLKESSNAIGLDLESENQDPEKLEDLKENECRREVEASNLQIEEDHENQEEIIVDSPELNLVLSHPEPVEEADEYQERQANADSAANNVGSDSKLETEELQEMNVEAEQETAVVNNLTHVEQSIRSTSSDADNCDKKTDNNRETEDLQDVNVEEQEETPIGDTLTHEERLIHSTSSDGEKCEEVVDNTETEELRNEMVELKPEEINLESLTSGEQQIHFNASEAENSLSPITSLEASGDHEPKERMIKEDVIVDSSKEIVEDTEIPTAELEQILAKISSPVSTNVKVTENSLVAQEIEDCSANDYAEDIISNSDLDQPNDGNLTGLECEPEYTTQEKEATIENHNSSSFGLTSLLGNFVRGSVAPEKDESEELVSQEEESETKKDDDVATKEGEQVK
jgi:hypothetical protein